MRSSDSLQGKMHDQSKLVQWHHPEVLIVDDDISLEPIWNYIIEKAHQHAHVTWATSEAEAMSLIEKASQENRTFDLLITDIFLSGSKTGIDLWVHCHQTLHERIIVTSGVEYDKFAKYLSDHTTRPLYLQKPLRIPDCIEAVYSMLQRST